MLLEDNLNFVKNEPESESRKGSEQVRKTENARLIVSRSGKSPHEIAEFNEIEICKWILRNGFTTELVISILLGTSKNDYCQRLVKRGLLCKTPVPPGWPVSRDYPANSYFTLSESGLTLALRYDVEVSNYPEIDPHKVRGPTFHHSVLFQIETAGRIRLGKIIDYRTERMLVKGKPDEKIPDGSWQYKNGKSSLIEIENRDRKEGNKLLKFASGLLDMLASGTYDYALVLVHTDTLCQHYKNAFKIGQTYYPKWVKDKGIYYPKENSAMHIDEGLHKRAHFHVFCRPCFIRRDLKDAVGRRIQQLTPVEGLD